MRRSPLALGLVAVLATTALADTPPSPAAVDAARALAEGKLEAAAAAKVWAEAGITPEQARALLASAGPSDPGTPGEQSIDLLDPHGTKTDLRVVVPDLPRQDGRYGLLVVLHGLRGNEEQLLPFARKIAPPGFIIAAPEAQWIGEDREAEDGGLDDALSGFLPEEKPPEGETAEQAAARKARTRRALEAAKRAILPHWWGYGQDGFPLLAVDAVRRRWPIDPDRVLLVGYSMGGFGTWNVGLRHPDRFAAIAPLAGGISRKEMMMDRDGRVRELLANGRMVPSFFVHGSRDSTVPTRFSRSIHQDLTALGATHVYEEVEGGGHILMPFLRGNDLTTKLSAWLAERVRDPHPRKVEHHVLGAYHGASYWVRVTGVSGPAAHVVAEVQEGDRIVVTTSGVTALEVFLDPALVGTDRPVRVEVDGRVVHEGPVAPSLEAVASSFAARGDASLAHARVVKVELAGSTAPAASTAPPAPAAPAAAPAAPAKPARRWF